ncbi:hypothetical protein [uncultured Desulfuromusa sp.]|uniref:hypothetical protein n=1 Tax=uncultured Desulfuromusa sp. TaxID=219183 RepID=UPI002AA7BFA7|nr:hypothetical protein [uncultured Desulfuromusa sp.]
MSLKRIIFHIIDKLRFVLLLGLGLLLISQTVSAAPCDLKLNRPFISHDLSNSYCELCGYGYITIVISNPYRYTENLNIPPEPDIPGATMSNMVLTVDLGSSGLVFADFLAQPLYYQISGTTNASAYSTYSPGSATSILTFDGSFFTGILAELESNPSESTDNTITIRIAVSRVNDPEGLVDANRTILSTLNFDTIDADGNLLNCGDSPQTDSDIISLHEPVPSITKTGWNYDAGQRRNSQSAPVYGNNNDDIVWHVQVDNGGLAELQDLRFDDLMQSGSIDLNYACATEDAANSIAANNGVAFPLPSECVPVINNSITAIDPFTVTAGGSASLFLVGKVTNDGSCVSSRSNTVDNLEWGCEEQTPVGGITETSEGVIPTDTASFYSLYDDVDHPALEVERQLTGVNTSQPVGTRGMMTITIRNNSGGSVKNIQLIDVLPPEYVVDPTFAPELDVAPAYGAAYPGLIDTLTWTNPEDDDHPLDNIAPAFDLTSSVAHPVYADQINMLRQGDAAEVRFRVVLIESGYYDRSANLDVNPEEFLVTGTDPTFQTPLSNTLTVDFDLFCSDPPVSGQGHQQLVLTGNGTGNPNGSNIPANPEDLDIAIGGSVFILTNDPDQLLTLPIELTNNGGHDAADYHAFVSFGATMFVENAPSACRVISLSGSPNQPAPWKVWVDPTEIPATATVYECYSPETIAPGQTITYNFEVRKTQLTDLDGSNRIALDDLSLRADVVGEITLSDGTPLIFPTPIVRDNGAPDYEDGELDRANNYSMDATWARVIGFNLKKTQIGTCNENNPPSFDTNGFEEVQIGEECRFHIETGGWFGFKTPGFIYIAVQNIDVVDQVPDGQAYISSTDPDTQSTTDIINGTVTLNPAGLTALDEGWFDWRFNIPNEERIQVADEWFIVDTTTRLLNKPIDQRQAPNVHARNSHNVLNSTFDATFSNVNTGLVETYSLGPDTIGYPIETVRRVDLTLTEPLITVVKEVCNESLYGSGTACSHFVPLADDGDAYNSYLYRITLTNEASQEGVQRAPAYDITVTDHLDGSDLAYVFPFTADGLDNDADGSSDETGANEEGTISDNNVNNLTPAQLTFSYTHSTALQRLDPGQSIELFYRVDYDDDAAPLQTFTNTVTATYDSLIGDSGSQTISPQLNSLLGGARAYSSDPVTADVRVMPVETHPKTVLRLANTPLLSIPGAQPVSVGEEIEYQLETLLPVALLRNFVVRDELPVGLRCSEAPTVNLDAAPYNAAGFDPGGTFTPTCTDDLVEWNFGDQRLTIGSAGQRFAFAIDFIAQVENSAATNDGDIIANGHPATVTTAEYFDETGTLVSSNFGQVDILVQEPLIELNKAFNVTEADAADTLTITVTATNSGTATAYNLRVLDNLDGTKLTYAGNVSGTDPPDHVDTTTLGPNQPIFSWNAPNGIAVGSSISFNFTATIHTDVQPLEDLINTLQADWTSLPDQTTTLNSYASIGENGSTTGMRNGTLPNSGDPINDYENTATAQLNVFDVVAAKTDLEPAIIPTIGAHKQFRISIDLPEGESHGVTVSDSLDAAGLSYVLANNTDFDINYSFDGISTINGQVPSEAAFNSWPADGTNGSATWDIGTVVTQTEDDENLHALDPMIHIDYFARVNNDMDTDAGDFLQNGATISYLNGETGTTETITATTPVVTVSEPDLTLTKTLANVTVGKNPGDPPFAGDILEYQLTIVNTGSANSTAFDINIVDTLPVGVILDSEFTPTATLDGVPVPGFVAIPAGAPMGPLTWGRANGDGTLDVASGQILLITYHTQVQVVAHPDGIIENGVWSDWTSLESSVSYERTGAGCPTIIAPDDYCVGPVFATTIGVAPELVFQKLVINETTGMPGVNAAPGDTLRYQLQVTNISTAPAWFSITDELDRLNSHSLFVPGSLTVFPGHGGTDVSDPTGGAAGTGLLDIRDIILDGGDTLTIEFTIELLPVINDATFVLNQAQLFLSGLGVILSDDPDIAGENNPTQTLIISSPQWQLQKTVEDLTGAATILFAGDLLRYSITVKNTGTENAVSVELRDSIPANTRYIAGSTTLNGESLVDPAPSTSPLEAGILINASEDPTAGVMRADTEESAENFATITFDVQVDETVPSGTFISNQGFLNGSGVGSGPFSEQPTDDPNTVDVNDPTQVVVSSLDFRKSVFNQTTSTDGSIATPGDILRYRLEIINTSSIPLNDLAVVDELESLQTTAPMLFVPGTLTLVSVPAGADTSGTDPAGGSKGTGLVDIRNLNVPVDGTLAIEFTVQLAAVITNGTEILNQADLLAGGQLFRKSDTTDATALEDEDPTVTLINSAPVFEVLKTSTFLDGDPAVLLAGESLRYTITIRNIGNENAVDVILRDFTPANTVYVINSTTLNGVAIADTTPGLNPLHSGILINVPELSTSGSLPAGSDTVAVVTFDVVVDVDAMDGLVIENQGFVNGHGEGSGAFPEQPSDDPATPVINDPTRNVVGNLPLLYSQKTVEIFTDLGSIGIVDPDDVLRYRITITNSGAIPSTLATLTDNLPNNTTYIEDSLRLNSMPIGSDGGVLPLIAGLPVNSDDNPGAGIISPGASAEITFEVQVNSGTPTGTLISNQGTVSSAELIAGLTDADGIASNGFQPTVIAVGDVQLLSITKDVSVVDGGSAEPGAELAYLIRITNIGSLPATQVIVTDDLNLPLGDQISYIVGSGRMDGDVAGISYAGNILTADYAAVYGNLAPGATFQVRFQAQIAADTPLGTTITNTGVVRWNNPQQSDSATAALDVGGTPGSAALNGRIWHDESLDLVYTADNENPQLDWRVELYLNNLFVTSVTTDSDGLYHLTGLLPSANVSGLYELRFYAPGAGVNTPSVGYADSVFTDGPQVITDISVVEGGNLQNLNLPLWPNGTIYNSVARVAVAGAGLKMVNAVTGVELPELCFDDPVQQNQVTTQNGFYKFDLNFSNAACPPGGSYLIYVTAPATGYLAAPSLIIPPNSDATTAAFSVPGCPGSAVDAVPATTGFCEAVASAGVPPLSIAAGSPGTNYHLQLLLNDGTIPGQSQIFNNPIPIDPVLDGAVVISKSASLTNVSKSSLVPYTITVTNIYGAPLDDISIVDYFPAGFKYVAGSARLNGDAVEPFINEQELRWNNLELGVNEVHTIKLLLVVSSGVSEGEYVNRARVFNTIFGSAVSGEASATVRVIPDPDMDCTDVIGKVFNDINLNGWQDQGESGMSGVRLVTARGLIATTDKHGRYHITCAVVPDEDRGSNFIMKLDDRSLPTGYRVTTENPRVQRATRGKMMRFNFGATIHRVVAIDIADGVFEPETTELRIQWQSKIDQLLAVLKEEPSVLRLSYLADVETEELVQKRLKKLKSMITDDWETKSNSSLTIETEIFWRRGSPPQR